MNLNKYCVTAIQTIIQVRSGRETRMQDIHIIKHESAVMLFVSCENNWDDRDQAHLTTPWQTNERRQKDKYFKKDYFPTQQEILKLAT